MVTPSSSSPTAPAGGICTVSSSRRGACGRSRPMAAEFGQPQWVFGMSTYAFAGPDRIVCTYSRGRARADCGDRTCDRDAARTRIPFSQFASVRAEGDQAAAIAGAPTLPVSVIEIDLNTGQYRTLKKATDILDRTEQRIAAYLTAVEVVEFSTTGGNTAFGLFYRPHNPDYAGPLEEKPPLLVRCHGGPTSAASSTLSLGIQYWTSRGSRCST